VVQIKSGSDKLQSKQ